MASTLKATTHQAKERNKQRLSSRKSAIASSPKTGDSAKKTATKAAAPETTAAPASDANNSPKALQEKQRQERQEQLAANKQKLLEQQRKKREKQKQRMEEIKKKRTWSLATFTLGLFVMLTALICLFPTTQMIIFSTLLMFSFFFLGVAFQRMVMQLLVIALASVFIVGAFYSIVNNY